MTNLFKENEDFIRKFIPPQVSDEEVVLVDITNVAYYTQLQEQDEFVVSDFILNLPWPVCWFEYKRPNKQMIDGKIIGNQNPSGDIIGVLCMYDEKTNQNTYQIFSHFDGIEKFEWDEWKEPETIRWFGGANKPIDHSDNGKVLASPWFKKGIMDGKITKELAKEAIENELTNVFYATTFAHCNNVEYYEKECPEALQKANIKRGKIPQETYKILDIGDLTRQAKHESNDSEGELSRALHICRGHFKTYTEENPLFGKYTGKYWWPMHKRGDSKNGTVNKEYKINTN